MPALAHVQEKIRLGIPLNPEEEAFSLKYTNSRGVESTRKWNGWAESPDSVIDRITE